MGLDISAYSKVKFEKPLDDPVRYDEDGIVVFEPEEGFEEHSSDLQPGCYLTTPDSESIAFRAGSYIGYSQFREFLCQWALRVHDKDVWNNPDTYRDKPFYWLINFSDCEGFIGPEKAAILARDFADHHEAFERYCATVGNEAYAEKYALFQRACELAADGGLVSFH